MKIARPILSNASYRLSVIPTTRSGNRTGLSTKLTGRSENRTTLCANWTKLSANWTTLCFECPVEGENLDITASKAVIPSLAGTIVIKI